MIKAEHCLKPAWVRQQCERALALMPVGSAVALWLDDRCLLAIHETDHPLSEGAPGVQAFPLMLEGTRVGALLLRLPVEDETARAQALGWGDLLTHALQGVLESEYGRRSVGRETLETYREMALLQRAVTDLNHSLKPAAVVAALLKEFDGRKGTADYGAVFVHGTDAGAPDRVLSFGEDATAAFGRLKDSRLFADMAAQDTGDIINDLSSSPLWAGEIADFHALLWLPLVSHGEALGLLVLASRRTEGFSAADLKRAQTLSSVAATALHNARLYAAEQEMFQSFVRVIATAIDAKSPYTAGHCRRVPEIALMIAESAHRAAHGPFADFVLTEEKRNALEIAAMLHDCGKMVTPEWVVDKATKLDSIVNRIQLIALRFTVLRRDALIDQYRAQAAGADRNATDAIYQARLRQFDDDFAFLETCNTGGEFISGEHLARIQAIAQQRWIDDPSPQRGEVGRGASNSRSESLPLLTENEVYNLTTQRGTLNPAERKIVEDHVVHTINMLSQIAFPRSLRHVIEYAAGHHERLDGTGYPRGLKRDQLSIPARIMAIADIFEALTAPDRPYRKPGTLSWAIQIMHRMKLDNHIDGDLFDLFLLQGLHLAYAQKYLAANQIDPTDITRYLG